MRNGSAQFKEVKELGFSEYNETETAEQNCRAEVFMYASEQMIKEVEAVNCSNQFYSYTQIMAFPKI